MSNIDKWIVDIRGATGLQTDAVRREAENDRERLKRHTLDEPKEYEKRLKAQSKKSAQLRAMRLAKEAQDRAAAPSKPAPKPRGPRTPAG
jgi:hypothetical protein